MRIGAPADKISQASNSADEFRMANKTTILPLGFFRESCRLTGGIEEESEKTLHDSGIKDPLVAILQPGESVSLYIHMSKYVCKLHMV